MIAVLPFRSTSASASFCALLVLVPALALAEGANPPPSDPPAMIAAPPDAPAPPQSGGRLLPTLQETFGAIGRFIDQSISSVGAGVKGAGETSAPPPARPAISPRA